MSVMPVSYLPGDPMLIDQIVWELKSQGIFDTFRKECIADVDTKPAYQNLRQRVEGSVSSFLRKQTWSPNLNKNQLREQLRKNIYESGYLETGVERIVDQVVNPKMNTVFLPKVTDVVYQYLGLVKPEVKSGKEKAEELKTKSEELLPNELEAVSPESKHDDKNDDSNLSMESMKIEEDESPPFEPLDEDNSVDSHMSGISGLQSHDSNSSPKTLQIDDTQTSKHSSDACMDMEIDDTDAAPADVPLVPTNDDINVKPEENDSNSNSCKQDIKKEERDVKYDDDNKDVEAGKDKDRAEKDNHKSDSKSRSRSESKSEKSERRHDKSRDRHRDKDRDYRDKNRDKDRSRNDKDRDKCRDSKKKDDRKYSSNSSRRDKDRDSSSKSSNSKSRDDKCRSRHDSSRDRKSSSSRSEKDKDRDKDKKYRDRKDDHYSSKHKSERRSTDRDSNDGSGLKSSSSSYCESNSSSQHSHKESTNSNSNDSGQNTNDKHESKQKSSKDDKSKHRDIKGNNVVLDSEVDQPDEVEIMPAIVEKSMSVSAASWDALEAQLASNVYNGYGEYYVSDNENTIEYQKGDLLQEQSRLNNHVAPVDSAKGKKIVTANSVESSKNSDKDALKYFSQSSIETDEINIKKSTQYLSKLQKEIDDAQSRLPKTTRNGCKKRSAETSMVSTDVKKTKNNNVVGNHIPHPVSTYSSNLPFHLPLSPAESDSDKSTDKKGDEGLPIPEVRRRVVHASQRYSSDDLYKPRPVIKRTTTRRRGNTDE